MVRYSDDDGPADDDNGIDVTTYGAVDECDDGYEKEDDDDDADDDGNSKTTNSDCDTGAQA